MKSAIGALALGLAFGAALSAPAYAADPSGVWLRDDGKEKIRVSSCGDQICGTVAWIGDTSSKAAPGQRVLSNFVPAGEGKWSGKAFNPEDGKSYLGKLSLSGNTLVTTGCVAGGLICKSVNWSRAN